jgi:hypothetical protein
VEEGAAGIYLEMRKRKSDDDLTTAARTRDEDKKTGKAKETLLEREILLLLV